MSWNILDPDRPVLWAPYSYGATGRASSFAFGYGDRELVIVSPPSGHGAAEYAELARHGRVSAVVAPNGYHHLGLRACLDACPGAALYADARSARRIKRKNPDVAAVDFAPLEALGERLGATARLTVPPGMRIHDAVAWVSTGRGDVWYFNDAVANHSRPSKNPLLRVVFKLTRTGPGFTVNRLLCLALVRDRRSYWSWLRAEVAAHPPAAVVVGHGKPVEGAEAARLKDLIEAELGPHS